MKYRWTLPTGIREKLKFRWTNTSKRWQTTENLNDDIRLEQNISIVADTYAWENYSKIRYVIIDNVAWRVTNVTVAKPRLNLYIGGLYNGETVKT